MDELEREVRAMLKDKAAGMPDEYDASEEFTTRVARRRNAKRAGVAGALVAVVVVAGLVAVGSTAGGSRRTVVATSTVPVAACLPVRLPDGFVPQGIPTVPQLVPGLDRKVADELAFYSDGDPLRSVLGPRESQCWTKSRVPSGDRSAIENIAVLSASDAPAYAASSSIAWDGDGVNIEVLYDGASAFCPPVANLTPQCATVFTSETRVAANAWVHRTDGVLTAARVTQPSLTAPETVTTALLRCQLPDQALCGPIIDDYIRRNPPEAAPATTTTVAPSTTTTIAPVTTVKSQGCALTAASGDRHEFPAPTVAARRLTGVSGTTAAAYASYIVGVTPIDAALTVLAPHGWACHTYEYGTGGVDFYVYPPSAGGSFGTGSNGFTTSEQYKGPKIKVMTESFSHGSGVDLACEVFASEGVIASAAPGRCTNTMKNVTKLHSGVYSFVDPNGAPGIAIGNVTSASPIAGSFSLLTCNLGAQSSLCNEIFTDYGARIPAFIPQLAPGVTVPEKNHGGLGVLYLDGHISTLKLGSSTAADVQAFAGTPDATVDGSFNTVGLPDYHALGYDCTATSAPNRTAMIQQPNLKGPYCMTIFYMNTQTNTLAAFETTSPKYGTEHGSTIGATESWAQHSEGKAPIAGCKPSAILLGGLYDTPPGPIGIFVYVGPKPTDVVTQFEVEWRANQVGLLAC